MIEEERPVLYVHVADDGGLLAIDGTSGRSAWVTEAEMRRRLDLLVGDGGSVLLSRESGSPLTKPAMDLIRATGLPVVLSREPHPDAVRSGGATALMAAAFVGAMDLLRDLLRRGADIEAQDVDGYTALMYACNEGPLEAVDLLIASGTDVARTDREGSTPLMFASQRGDLGIVKRLLAEGVDPTRQRTVDGLTARYFASSNGHERVAAVLLSAELQWSDEK